MSKVQAENLTKLYYSIGEVADMFDVNTSLIRFWEKEFSAIQPKKNKKGNRLFTSKDILIIDRIYFLVKEKGFTLEGAKSELRKKKTTETPKDETDTTEVIVKLKDIRRQLLELKSNSN